tara:strand:- start:276 stop:1058 length:783 start_codon:yes stop_codon:yes gene_type:complete
VRNNCWLDAKNITSYKQDYKVIKNLSLKIFDNERIVILGPNGSGKSSIVDLINRNIYPLVKKNSYFRIFNEELIDIWKVRKYISTVNNEIKLRINKDLKVKDILLSGLYGSFCKISNPQKEDKIKVDELIERMFLNDIANKRFGYLSDGEKQISIIARAIINDPKVLILDEPSVNLDLKSRIFLIKKIQNLSQLGINILCITHDISFITKDYNRLIFLKNRKIIRDGKPIELMKSDYINELFDINIKLIENNYSWDVNRK